MTEAATPSDINLLLSALPSKELRHWLGRLEVVTLEAGTSLGEAGSPIEYLHFPRKSCLISMVRVLADQKRFDTALVGYEGVVGVESFLGVEKSQFSTLVRLGGEALRISTKALQAELQSADRLSGLLQRYLQYLLVACAQLSGCNRFHSLERRFSSWLLQIQDRLQTAELEITHATFAAMLGVRRVGITQATRKLQRAGLIRNGWGKVTILDRQRLEAHACICYQQITQAYQHLLDPNWPHR